MPEYRFPLSDRFSWDRLALPEGLSLHKLEDGHWSLGFYDSADNHLRHRQMILEQRSDRGEIVWRSLNGQGVLGRLRPAAADAEDGSLYDPTCLPAARLRRVLLDRPTQLKLRLQTRRSSWVVRNTEGKGVARLHEEHPEIRDGAPYRLALPPALVVEPLRGYGRAVERLLARLKAELDRDPVTEPLYDQARAALEAARQPLDPVMPAHEAFARAGRAQAERLRRALALWQQDQPVDAVHQLRVALRRSRCLIRMGRTVFEAPAADYEKRFRSLSRATGRARDLDVLILRAEQFDGLADAAVQDALRRLRARSGKAVAQVFDADALDALVADWCAFLDRPPSAVTAPTHAHRSVRAVTAKRLWKDYGKLIREGDRIGPGSPPEQLHALRKHVKRLRYGLDFFVPLWPEAELRAMIKPLKKLQTVLGRHQDAAVARGLFNEAAQDRRLPAAARKKLVALVAWCDREEAEARSGFDARFAALKAEDALWRGALAASEDDL